MFIQYLMAHLGIMKNEKGQGMVEYALIIALIAVVVAAVLVLFGPQIAKVFSDIGATLPE